MKICELCGMEEETENNGKTEAVQTRMLHLCENCRNDRKFEMFIEDQL
ncbi:hypothetical protein [Bacillus massiliglaciei]|nr:hypothetical protein [Bacillus massiliglaciei]